MEPGIMVGLHLQVPMDDVTLVQIVHPARNRHCNLGNSGRGQAALLSNDVIKASTVHVLKHNAKVGPHSAGTDELHNILMADFLHDGDFLHKLLILLRVAVNIFQDFDCYLLPTVYATVQVAKGTTCNLPIKVQGLDRRANQLFRVSKCWTQLDTHVLVLDETGGEDTFGSSSQSFG